MMKQDNDDLFIDKDEVYDDISDEEFPEHVLKFTEKQEREERDAKIFAAEMIGVIVVALGILTWICFSIYA